jgi:hypothetical protein
MIGRGDETLAACEREDDPDPPQAATSMHIGITAKPPASLLISL